MALTIEEAIKTFGVEIDPHLARDVDIPVLSGLQFQGDVAVVPAGIAVVRGESGGNTHLLLAQGEGVRFAAAPEGGSMTTNLDLGVLEVSEGSTAFLAHPEHAYTGVGPGTYTIRRQREQADEIRLVAD